MSTHPATHLATHLATDPTATGAAVFPSRPEWLTLSAAFADEVPAIAARDDLLVSVAPGAGGGAPACFYPARALIELDGAHLGVDPATVDPANLSDRARYGTAWGLLTHECGHAHHTSWDPPEGAPPGAVAAALLLEEPRMEAAHIRRRPDDRHWLRASTTSLILDDAHRSAAHPSTGLAGSAMTAADAATAAALLMGRVDGGILTATEVAPVARVVEDVLGPDTLAELRAVWQDALRTDDDDTETMIDLGRRWCAALGTDPATDPSSDASTGSDPSASDPSASGAAAPSPLAEAVTAVLDRVERAVAAEDLPADPAAVAAARKEREDTAEAKAGRVAGKVFASSGSLSGSTAFSGTRAPTSDERTAARVLARALDTAGVPERVAVRSTSQVPPGRLRMRGVRAGEAQRAAGAVVTAEPFTRITRRKVEVPPLRIGVACDVSGSMGWAREHVASAAWILADAARHTRVPAQSASVIFGHYVRPLTHPGKPPARVTEFEAADGTEAIPRALDALDGALGLSRPGAARLLVIVSDGDYSPGNRTRGQQRLDRLRASGCAVLWLTTNTYDKPLNGATVHRLDDPATTARAIGHAASAALRAITR